MPSMRYFFNRFKAGLCTAILALNCSLSVAASDCQGEGTRLQVLGSGGPELDDGRASSSYLVWRRGRAVLLVDAGSGSSVAFDRSGALLEDLSAILLTHLHTDHAVDLPAYVKGGYFSERDKALLVLGPSGNQLMPSTRQYVEALLGEQGAFRYLSDHTRPMEQGFWIDVRDVDIDERELWRMDTGNDIQLSALGVDHGPVAAVAWRVEVGSCTLVFGGDTTNARGNLERLARGADILIAHVGIADDTTGPATRLFATPRVIGEIAQRAGVGTLVLSHFMNRSQRDTEALVASVRNEFKGRVIAARDMSFVE
ncbi:MBL fold metallo-hydrolase [Parahaliea maris]|nr:MBL fold metallo-hydrolase [Parahaliea maris]